jgi:hypothetical protein
MPAKELIAGMARSYNRHTIISFAGSTRRLVISTNRGNAVPFSRYLCTITETMEQCRHDIN